MDKDLTEADFEQAAAKELSSLVMRAIADPEAFARDYWKLLDIIAVFYQVAGAQDAPEWVLDLLSDPEEATAEEVDKLQRRSGWAQ